jgi:hypothetical protein
VFDLDADPRELENLADTRPDLTESLMEELARWLKQEESLREHIDAGETRELTPEMLDELRALGYIE